MKIKHKSLLGGALLLTLASSSIANAAIQVTLNDQPLATSVEPVRIGGATMVPMRDIFEALGAQLTWNALAQTITAHKDVTTIELAINNPNAVVNGRTIPLSQPAQLIGGKTFVPLRFVAEALNAQVGWNDALQLVSIHSQPLVAANPVPGVEPSYQTPVAPLPATDPNSPLYIPPATDPGMAPVTDDRDHPRFRHISVPAGSVIPVQFDRSISSANARVGDVITATIVSRKLGDSEFPAGTRLEALVVEAQPRQSGQPGVLDFDFRAAILPNGDRVPLRGNLTALDNSQVVSQGGRVVARNSKSTDKLKVVGIGAGAGFVLGKVLKTNSTLTTILGAAGGYLVGKSQDKRAAEATVPANSTVGVQLTDPVRYRDSVQYAATRENYLRDANAGISDFDPTYYGADTAIAGPRRGDRMRRYDGYDNYDNAPMDVGNVYTDNPAPLPVPAPRTDNWNRTSDAVPNPVTYRDISIPEGAVVPVTLDQALSSATAQVGQAFSATVDSRQIGDSEFPVGTKIRGRVSAVQPRDGDQPGQLELDFSNVVLPNGQRINMNGELISLDNSSTTIANGRIIAKGKSGPNKLKVIGIGAAAGFVVGRIIKKDGVLPSLLGALGGYLYGNSQTDKPAEATLPVGARLGVRLNQPISYSDNTYYPHRLRYLQHGG